MIRDVKKSDVPALCEIYNHYVSHTVITFEEAPVSETEMTRRIDEVTRRYPWLVFEQGGTLVGFAYASTWKSRSAFRYSAESTVYVSPDSIGQRIGSQLYEALFSRLPALELHSVVGGIALPNPASVKLHERFGFKKVAHFNEMGRKFNQWIDLGYWELLLPENRTETETYE
ncbi:GNAT family N-acetyltransferase [Pontiellaceae bacterium B12219]|nr:GNAT family N-acetyltransferase [Pontiellaceae bacterium B12219]